MINCTFAVVLYSNEISRFISVLLISHTKSPLNDNQSLEIYVKASLITPKANQPFKCLLHGPRVLDITCLSPISQLDKTSVIHIAYHAPKSVLLECLMHSLKSTRNKAYNKVGFILLDWISAIVFASLVIYMSIFQSADSTIGQYASMLSRGQNLVVNFRHLLPTNVFGSIQELYLAKKFDTK